MQRPKTYGALVIVLVLSRIGPTLASAAMITINPTKDNTLYEYDPADGDLSNGAGFHFFAGENATGETRRGVIAFDIAGHIPPGSTLGNVSGGEVKQVKRQGGTLGQRQKRFLGPPGRAERAFWRIIMRLCSIEHCWPLQKLFARRHSQTRHYTV